MMNKGAIFDGTQHIRSRGTRTLKGVLETEFADGETPCHLLPVRQSQACLP
jgi:hypothetical protein